MLIVGAKGFAKEVLEVVKQSGKIDNLVFYDDVNINLPELLFEQFPILKTVNEAAFYFKNTDERFTIGIGNPILRKKLGDKFIALGGKLTSTISRHAVISSFDVEIGIGSNILSGATFSPATKIGKGCLIYYNAIITHDCKIGDFVEVSPSATILGRVTIGSYAQIGANATILPDLKIGKNVIIGAGAVVTTNIPDNSVAVGIPAKIIKILPSLGFS